LEPTCTVLGLFENWHSEIVEVTLAPGDTLVLYTDGVTEATDAKLEEFGDERLITVMQGQGRFPVEQVVDGIVTAVRQFSDGEQQDDITLVVARCTE
jgi:sigma-B regulation protein RsbU (phosphoserine phosphatase)